jgi:hypothetical protein
MAIYIRQGAGKRELGMWVSRMFIKMILLVVQKYLTKITVTELLIKSFMPKY